MLHQLRGAHVRTILPSAQNLTTGQLLNTLPGVTVGHHDFSPDGKMIYFTSDRGGSPQIYLMNADGSGVRRLTFQGNYNQTPAFSPRGNHLAFTARDDDKGHFHLTGPELWFMLEGQNEFKIGDLPLLVADQGDIVYAPAQVWHRPRHVGNGMATRLAIVGYANSHVYQPAVK